MINATSLDGQSINLRPAFDGQNLLLKFGVGSVSVATGYDLITQLLIDTNGNVLVDATGDAYAARI